MASWKKVIVSGSAAELLNITASAGLFNTSLNVGTNQQITTSPATTFLSGSFSGSFFQGDGSGLFNIPKSALSGDSPRIASGSVTASVSPDDGFRVISINSGSQFSGSVNISGSLSVANLVSAQQISGSSISGSFQGDGSRLKNVPSQESARIHLDTIENIKDNTTDSSLVKDEALNFCKQQNLKKELKKVQDKTIKKSHKVQPVYFYPKII